MLRYMCPQGEWELSPVLQVEGHHQPREPQEVLRHRLSELRAQVQTKYDKPRQTGMF